VLSQAVRSFTTACHGMSVHRKTRAASAVRCTTVTPRAAAQTHTSQGRWVGNTSDAAPGIRQRQGCGDHQDIAGEDRDPRQPQRRVRDRKAHDHGAVRRHVQGDVEIAAERGGATAVAGQRAVDAVAHPAHQPHGETGEGTAGRDQDRCDERHHEGRHRHLIGRDAGPRQTRHDRPGQPGETPPKRLIEHRGARL
jgi:hypothetical protein